MMNLEKGIYRHYKGNLYEVLMRAQHSETEEWMVITKLCMVKEEHGFDPMICLSKK